MPDLSFSCDLNVGATCSIQLGSGAIQTVGDRIRAAGLRPFAHVVADRRVWELHEPTITRALSTSGLQFKLSLVARGEASKSIDGLSDVLNNLAVAHHERTDALIAIGGGVTTDLAGFAAAIWQRGVPWVCCPTSLEAAIDAGIGGKTAINLPAGKNLVGAFHHPRAIVIDLDLLATLPQRDFVAALAESVKHGIVASGDFLQWQRDHVTPILTRDRDVIARLIEANIRIKAKIVAADPRETATQGVGRAALNLGHTIGHALEATPHLELRHGEAVALGLRAELALAESEFQFPPSDRVAIESLLDDFGLPRHAPAPFDTRDVLARMRVDKKNKDGRVRFALPRRIGDLAWWSADNTAAVERVLHNINPTPPS